MSKKTIRPVRLVRPIYVVSDDLTGAAEIAGIASSFGLCVSLLMALPDGGLTDDVADVVVIATDTRSAEEREAVDVIRRVSQVLPDDAVLFKKTDSALRGHIMAEIRSMMDITGLRQALFIPANPSKGRIIRNGTYYIEGVQLSQTAFSHDPEFPAMTSSVHERFPEAEGLNILLPDVYSVDDIKQCLEQTDDHTLLAGAADLFSVLLQQMGCKELQAVSESCFPMKEVLVACGSTQSHPENLPIPVAPMPLVLYNGDGNIDEWVREASTLYAAHQALALSIPHHHLTGKKVAVRLRETMAEVVKVLVGVHRPEELIVEGGATAFACCSALRLAHFSDICQLAPGVVRMCADNGMHVTLKPGSYPWGNFKSLLS